MLLEVHRAIESITLDRGEAHLKVDNTLMYQLHTFELKHT